MQAEHEETVAQLQRRIERYEKERRKPTAPPERPPKGEAWKAVLEEHAATVSRLQEQSQGMQLQHDAAMDRMRKQLDEMREMHLATVAEHNTELATLKQQLKGSEQPPPSDEKAVRSEDDEGEGMLVLSTPEADPNPDPDPNPNPNPNPNGRARWCHPRLRTPPWRCRPRSKSAH